MLIANNDVQNWIHYQFFERELEFFFRDRLRFIRSTTQEMIKTITSAGPRMEW